MAKIFYKTKLRLGFGVLSLCILALAGIFYEISRVRADLASRSYNTRQLINTIALLESRIGYGGFIHNFKNAMLRPDEGNYIAAARADYDAARLMLDEIEALADNEGIRTNLAALEHALALYARQLEALPSLLEEELSPSEIDSRIRVQDAEAVAALQRLVDRATAEVEEIVHRYVGITNWLTWLSFVTIVLMGSTLALILGSAYLNRVARTATENAIVSDAKSLADRMFAGEMVHRLNNLMATIHSINRQTLRTSRSARDHSEALAGRLNALSVAQNLAVERFSEEVDLKALVARLAAPHENVARMAPRVTVSGVDIWLSQMLASQMSLVFHELLTNATKHGALREAGGRIEVCCRKTGPRRFEVLWHETGGPPAQPPAGKGFGMRFVEQVVQLQMKGTCRFEFRPEGLRVRLAFPLDRPEETPRLRG